MDAFHRPGAVSWTELTTPAPAATPAFYGKLSGWHFETMDLPTVGRFAMLQGPQGATVCAIADAPRPG